MYSVYIRLFTNKGRCIHSETLHEVADYAALIERFRKRFPSAVRVLVDIALPIETG